jgi:hypothetical protein
MAVLVPCSPFTALRSRIRSDNQLPCATLDAAAEAGFNQLGSREPCRQTENAPREIRTPTVQTDHKALNLAREVPDPSERRGYAHLIRAGGRPGRNGRGVCCHGVVTGPHLRWRRQARTRLERYAARARWPATIRREPARRGSRRIFRRGRPRHVSGSGSARREDVSPSTWRIAPRCRHYQSVTSCARWDSSATSSPSLCAGPWRASGERPACGVRPTFCSHARRQTGTTARLYRLTHGTPASIVAGWSFGSNLRDNLPDPVVDWFAGTEPPDEAVELLRIAGF